MAIDTSTPFIWGGGGAMLTPDQITARRKVAEAMMASGTDASPILSPWQGVDRVAKAMLGGYRLGEIDRAEKATADYNRDLAGKLVAGLAGTLGQGGEVPSPGIPATAAPAAVPAPKPAVPSPTVPAAPDSPAAPGTRPEVVPSAKVWGDKEAEDAGIYEKPVPAAAKPATVIASNAPMVPVPATPAPAAPAPATPPRATGPSPGVATVASAINPAILAQAVTSPYASDSTRALGVQLLTAAMNQNKVSTIDLGNKVGVMDARGNIVRTIDKGEPNKGPSFVDGPPDPATGLPTKVWADPRDKSVTPYAPPANPAAEPSTIPPVPPGVDPKVWREAQSKRATDDAMPASGDATSKLRNEVQGLPSYKNIAQAAPVYKSMLDAAGRDNRAADVNMIYGMAKIMDPGSVVRESEMTVAQAIATLPQQLQAAVKSQLTGEGRLTPELRAAIMQEAQSRISAYKAMFDQDMGMYRGIAERNRMNHQDVIPTFGPFESFKVPVLPAPAPQPAAPTAAPVPAGVPAIRRYNPATGTLE